MSFKGKKAQSSEDPTFSVDAFSAIGHCDELFLNANWPFYELTLERPRSHICHAKQGLGNSSLPLKVWLNLNYSRLKYLV